MFSRVYDFNQNVVGIEPRLPYPLAGGEKQWLTGVLHEEADEFDQSHDLIDQVDSLVDSIIFAIGGLYRLGLSEDQAEKCMNAVMDANMEKKKGQKPGRIYEGVSDAIKPEGWVGPEERIAAILEGAKVNG